MDAAINAGRERTKTVLYVGGVVIQPSNEFGRDRSDSRC
jgi:hypothetical protein